MTLNHNYNTPEKGSIEWHNPLNDNFHRLDTGVEIRDVEANRDQYTPSDGGKFLATDTGRRYLGDGTQWIKAPSHSPSKVVLPRVEADPVDATIGSLWYRTDLDEVRTKAADSVVTLAGDDPENPGSDAEIIWRMTFEDPAPEAQKDYSNRSTRKLRRQLLNRGWDYVNYHVDHGLTYGDGNDAKTGDHSLGFWFFKDERMGFSAKRHIGVTEAWAQYWIKFEDGFDVTDNDHKPWADGGKMPGWHITKDIEQTDPGKAWLTFHDPDRAGFGDHDRTGKVHLNYYVENHNETDAGTEEWNRNGVVDTGKWYELTLYCNTDTGALKAWVDHQDGNGPRKAFDNDNHNWAGRDLKWCHISHFGGGWYSPKNQALYTDDLRVYKSSPL